ncbi:hypothetical protein D1825_09970 [Cellulomonas rhizosphaerae]|uniref:Uncharacterized protein n=1 Tax=Cellulomonas rhizosphaerae TaxID=2293719 RepID=A0A413RL88_9CELL|nr:hypothetical protein D1825_09970 [Cellulomonas rhizosphaerae]
MLAIPLASAVVEMIARMASDDPQTHKEGAWIFFQTGLYCIAAGLVLWTLWRRSFRARPHRLHTDQSDWAWRGVPEMDAPPREHLTLNGDGVLPPRW